MGQEQSSPIDESAPSLTLDDRSVDALARYIKDGRAKRIVVMTGAGISTSAGIPDFRSPETGLYANLARLNLPYAEAVFDISYFRENPLPFYTLAQELYPGKFRPTITHSFVNLLHKKGLLLKVFTQNIDCLEREAGVPDELIIEAHGSFARQRCIECKTQYPNDLMHEAIANKSVPRCLEEGCGGLVKPDIVFFGEQLPSAFFDNRGLPGEADLCIVMGTSLSVQPFASLPEMCREETPRLLINKERVGQMGCRADDVLLLTDCDDGVRQLARACGWLDELEKLWSQTAPASAKDIMAASKGDKPTEAPEASGAPVQKTKDEQVADEVDRLSKQVEEALKLSSEHSSKTKEQLKSASNPAGITQDLKSDSTNNASEATTLTATGPSTLSSTEDKSTTSTGLGHVFPHLDKKSSL